jgi:hypothetical protein
VAKVSDLNTTSIRDAIVLGCRTMCNVFDADDNDTPFFFSHVLPPPARLAFFAPHSDTHVPGRHLNALLSAEDAVGIEVREECIGKHARAAFRSLAGPVALPLNRPEKDADYTAFAVHNCRETFFALYALAHYRDSEEALDAAERFMGAIREYWDPERGWDADRLAREHGVDCQADTPSFPPGLARAIGALVSLYEGTGLDAPLELARTFVQKATDECYPADGSYHVERLTTHVHSITCTLSGLAQFAELTDDAGLMERVRRFYSNGLRVRAEGSRQALRDQLGWSPEGDRPTGCPDMGEANNTGDILETALILGRRGHVEAYHDAELILRGHLLPSQLRDVSFIEDPPNPDGVDGLRDVANRHLGAYGFPAPYGHMPTGLEPIMFHMDIVGGAVSSLCKAYHHVIRREGEVRRVELLFDHEAEGLTVESPYGDGAVPPQDGVLRLRADEPGDVMVRVPPWVRSGELRVDGEVREPEGGYVRIEGPPVGQWVRVEFPLVERELTLHHATHEIRVRLRGDCVVAMDNFATDLTFFDPFE